MKKSCVICASKSATKIRTVTTVRTQREVDLYACRDCFSFFNPGGYRETETQLEADLEWNIGVSERNREYARKLFTEISRRLPGIKSILEVGCGTGTALGVARDEFGFSGTGYDVNSRAVEWGRENYGLNLHSSAWEGGTETKADLLTCISCLEHVEEPRGLLQELAKGALRMRCPVFISVPFFEIYQWQFLDDPDPGRSGTPFFDNDVHVSHFSVLGLVKAMRSFGLPVFEVITAGWMGVLFQPEPSISGKLRAANRFRKWKAAYLSRVNTTLQGEDCPASLNSFR